jgi:hypothetical protein
MQLLFWYLYQMSIQNSFKLLIFYFVSSISSKSGKKDFLPFPSSYFNQSKSQSRALKLKTIYFRLIFKTEPFQVEKYFIIFDSVGSDSKSFLVKSNLSYFLLFLGYHPMQWKLPISLLPFRPNFTQKYSFLCSPSYNQSLEESNTEQCQSLPNTNILI